MDYIKLEKSNIKRFGIKTDEGVDTGEYLEFDLGDINLPLRYQEMTQLIKKNAKDTKIKLKLLEKEPDGKTKGYLTIKEEKGIRILNEFYKKQTEAYNLFLGENGVQKLLNGQAINWDSLKVINDYIKNQLAPKLDLTMKSVTDRIKKAYSFDFDNEEELK